MKVAIVGGTGAFGRVLAERLRSLGNDVTIGSRDPGRASEMGAVIGVRGVSNEDAVRGSDLVVLSVRSNAALATARELAPAIGNTPVLSVASDLRFTDAGVMPGRDSYSLAEEIAAAIAAPVASGFQSLSAVHLAGHEPPDQDVLVCGDDDVAKERALELAGRLVRGRAIDAGPLANSRALEGMTAVILNVNRRYGGHAGIRLTGLP